jgi:hypothetical protein
VCRRGYRAALHEKLHVCCNAVELLVFSGDQGSKLGVVYGVYLLLLSVTATRTCLNRRATG